MNIENKIQEIIRIQNVNSEEKIGGLNVPMTNDEIKEIEKYLGEPLLNEIKDLYAFANGQFKDEKGAFFGERFLSSIEIIKLLEFSSSLVKPEVKTIDNPLESEKLIKKIIDLYIDQAPKHRFWGIKKSWYKIQFECGLDAYGGPYLYKVNSPSVKREIIEIDHGFYKIVSKPVKDLHSLEKVSYNWDKLEFVVYSNGKYEVKRTFHDFSNMRFTSTPENSIKKKYFHHKWLPIFADYGGNCIGIDLDPDVNGKKGQVINFGRDEERMVVLADNFGDFLDFILSTINKPGNELLDRKYHLHDTLKQLKNKSN